MTTALEPITLDESKRLTELEAVIKTHSLAFVAVGDALSEIRDSKLYRADYGTFEAYCKDVWGWSGSRARQICTAAEFTKSVTTGNAPQTEREARKMMKELKPVKQESQEPSFYAFDSAELPSPATAEDPVVITKTASTVIELCEISLDNLRYLVDEIKPGKVDCGELKDIRDHNANLSKWLNKLSDEIC